MERIESSKNIKPLNLNNRQIMEPKTTKVAVKISFIIPEGYTSETECSEDMHKAFEMCTQNLMNVSWINSIETSYLNELQKDTFIVFQTFEGELFEKVKCTKSARIIGPLCLLSCLSEGRPIPNTSWPIYNMAMADCYVACSHIQKNMKLDIKDKVQKMGGYYIESVYQICTHLITDSVKSEKYLKAAESGIEIMLPEWVDTVWESSQSSNIHCKNMEFESYHCLPLQNLSICLTGFHVLEERERLQKLIQENGAKYSGQMNLRETDILICKENTTSEKFKAAQKSKNVRCLTIDWITDSIEKGYALPDANYLVNRGTSTPTKSDEFLNPNFSVLSAIGNTTNLGAERSILQETINTTNIPNTTDGKKRKSGSINDIDKIDLKKLKRAETFLDGCSIFLAGFSTEHRERLCKILNFSGATRYEELSDRLTHIIAGNITSHELKLIQSKALQIPIVNVQWLIECVEKKKIVSEDNYVIKTSPSKECGSPLSKKGLQFLRNASVAEVNDYSKEENTHTLEGDINSEIMMQYLKPALTNQEDTLAQLLKDGTNLFNANSEIEQSNTLRQSNITSNTSESVTTTQNDLTDLNPIFQGLKVMIINFEEEQCELIDSVKTLGGKVVSKLYKGIPDYAIIPAFNSEFSHTAKEIVTDYYLTDCWKDNELKQIQYYHRPFTVKNTNVLKGCVVTISGYTGTERLFLGDLIKELGGICQDQFSRYQKKGILASTHLVSSVASGAKYEAALKWQRPIMNKEWLLECAKLGEFITETDFSVGTSQASRSEKSLQVQEETVTPTEAEERTMKPGSLKENTPEKTDLKNVTTPKKIIIDLNFKETPTSSRCMQEQHETADFTPENRKIGKDDSPNVCSQVTPVTRIMNQFRRNYTLGTPPSSPPLPKRYGEVDTPDTPYGAFIRPNPSPHLRKEMLKWINKFPEKKKTDSTPLTELKKRLWNKICPPRFENKPEAPNFDDTGDQSPTSPELPPKQNTSETPENRKIDSHLQQLKNMLSSSGGTRKIMKKRESALPVQELKSSQACTVEWEYGESSSRSRDDAHFMLSGFSMDERDAMVKQLQSLGATVSDLSNYDPASTHLITNKPSRNEKMLSSMAGGKWILHTDFIKKSLEADKLLNEEQFEYGNPKFSKDIDIQFDTDTEIRAKAIHWWRKEIAKRGYGAFHDMRAIVISNKKASIIKVIEAGGGIVIDASPPFKEEIYATHCLLDPKCVSNLADYVPLAEQGIYIFNTVYINDFLHQNVKDVKEYILPNFLKYYM